REQEYDRSSVSKHGDVLTLRASRRQCNSGGVLPLVLSPIVTPGRLRRQAVRLPAARRRAATPADRAPRPPPPRSAGRPPPARPPLAPARSPPRRLAPPAPPRHPRRRHLRRPPATP